ncbi:MAG: ferritin family protein [Acidobacteriota bacterium]|jgi:rubrerythrin
MTIDLDFSKLSGSDVLDMAIAIEDEATIYYEQLAEWVGDGNPDVVDFFERMAVREKRHHDQIVALRDHLFAEAAKSHADKVSWAVEAPDVYKVPDNVTLRQAFEVAMDAETRAHDFYAGALEYATDDQVTELFEGLRQAEADHKRMLKEEMEKRLR